MSTAAVWAAILSSVALGLAGACLFVFAARRQYFAHIEDAKYHVFWSDLPPDSTASEDHDDRAPQQ